MTGPRGVSHYIATISWVRSFSGKLTTEGLSVKTESGSRCLDARVARQSACYGCPTAHPPAPPHRC